jgi:U3 small nucleolar RNA-associated protein 4
MHGTAGFPALLAAACDDGSVRLLGAEGGEAGLVPERLLARLQVWLGGAG